MSSSAPPFEGLFFWGDDACLDANLRTAPTLSLDGEPTAPIDAVSGPEKGGKWPGYRTTKALAWVMDVGYGQWMARRGNEVCNPTNLAEAKRQAFAMAVGGIGDYQVSHPIKELHSPTASSRIAMTYRLSQNESERRLIHHLKLFSPHEE